MVIDGSYRLRCLLHSVARGASQTVTFLLVVVYTTSLIGIPVHWVHFISENFLERWSTWQAIRWLHLLLLMAKLAHLVLNIPKVLILRVICLDSPIVLHGLHSGRIAQLLLASTAYLVAVCICIDLA